MSAESPGGARRSNGLAGETSPYLLQHQYNPVDWQPWGPAALARARAEDKPIFLSIGYAACHWCHVMERESFEDPAIAALLNCHFVPIKVDREERPDLDEIYMSAVQLMTGQGGWPLNVFLTPRLEPFFGGTYFPPAERHGRLGFATLLERVHESWTRSREAIDRSAAAMTASLARLAAPPPPTPGARVGRAETTRAVAEIVGRFDPVWGGLGGAPKFPPDGALALLLLEHAQTGQAVPLAVAERTLEGMARGGIYDHVGGGFARYSVDERWLVPHFEKMLYNQALLVPSYVDAWLLTRKPVYRRVVEGTLDFVARELTDPAGGFWSSLDADSEGEEGKFYVWTPEEIDALLGREDGALWRTVYDVTPEGNFEGHSIPNLLGASLAELARDRQETEATLAERLAPLTARLLAARAGRVRPATDDKVLAAWNGLMISACCRAYQALGRPADLALARRAAEFLWSTLVVDGRLLASWRGGSARLNAYLDDHAFVGRALLDLYESGFERVWLERAAGLAGAVLERFEDREGGGFFFTSHDHETLLTRTRSLTDGALPAGAGVATELLLRLSIHLDRDDFRSAAERALSAHVQLVRRAPSGFCSLLVATDRLDRPRPEIGLAGRADDPALAALLSVVRGRVRGNPVVQLTDTPGDDSSELPLLRGRRGAGGRATAWVCRDYACAAPTSDPDTLSRQLGDEPSS